MTSKVTVKNGLKWPQKVEGQNSMKLYGFKGRVISAVAAIAGVLSAFVAAAQAANLFTLVPEDYAWIVTALPIVALFFTVFSERIQGGASLLKVRNAAAASDAKNEREVLNA